MSDLATSERTLDRAQARARRDRLAAGAELRTARRARSWSLETGGRRAAMSASQVSRIERGLLAAVTHDQLVRLGAVVGLDIRLRAYPGADLALDTPQLRLLGRLIAILPAPVAVPTEVTMPIPGDQRAWDACLRGLRWPTGEAAPELPVDAETRLTDVQAQIRRLTLKWRDSGASAVVLLVADTRHNRAVLAASEASLRANFRVSPRSALAGLRRGEHPGGAAIIRL